MSQDVAKNDSRGHGTLEFSELLEQLRFAHAQEVAALKARLDELQERNHCVSGPVLDAYIEESARRGSFDFAPRLPFIPPRQMPQSSSGDFAIEDFNFHDDEVRPKHVCIEPIEAPQSPKSNSLQPSASNPLQSAPSKESCSSSLSAEQRKKSFEAAAKAAASNSIHLPFEKRHKAHKLVHNDGSFRYHFKKHRQRAHKLVEGALWETIWAGMICLNAGIMCAEAQHAGYEVGYEIEIEGFDTKPTETFKDVFLWLEWIFGILFLFEAGFKLSILGYKYFFDIWHWLDLGTVILVLFEGMFHTVLPFNTHSLRLLRIVKLVRLVRLLRDLEAFDALHLMTTAIKSSLTIFLWSIVLLLFFQTTAALFMCQILQTTYFEDATGDAVDTDMFKYFGTFSRATLTMFELSLANWTPVTRLLFENLSEWFGVVILGYKLTIGFAVIGIINAVFMQETFNIASTDDNLMVRSKFKSQRTHEDKMKSLFTSLDISKDGKLTFEELCAIAHHSKVKTWLHSMDIHTDDMQTLFWLLDNDRDGEITLKEFIDGTAKLKGNARSIDMATLVKKALTGNELDGELGDLPMTRWCHMGPSTSSPDVDI